MKYKIKKSDLIYYFIFINAFCKGIGLGNSSFVYTILMGVGLIFVCFKMIDEKYSRNEMIIVSLLMLVGLTSVIITHKVTLALTCITISSMKNTKEFNYISKMFWIRLLTLSLLVFLSLAGIITPKLFYDYRDGTVLIRNGLGYTHPNTLHISLFTVITLYLLCKKNKTTIIELGVLLFINYFVYTYSRSRTGMITVIFTLIASFGFERSNNKKIKKLFAITPFIAFVFFITLSFVSSAFYNSNNIFEVLNRLVNSRIQFSSYYLKQYGFSLFGHRDLLLDENAQFDSSYIMVFIQYGFVGFITWVSLMCICFKKIYLNVDLKKAAVLLGMVIYMFTEGFGPNIFVNYFLLFSGTYIFDKFSNKKLKRSQYKAMSNIERGGL